MSVPGLKVRRNQMSAVFQVVFTTMAGVPAVPNPPRPLVQSESSKLVAYQFAAGVVKVYFQVWATVCEVGTTGLLEYCSHQRDNGGLHAGQVGLENFAVVSFQAVQLGFHVGGLRINRGAQAIVIDEAGEQAAETLKLGKQVGGAGGRSFAASPWPTRCGW